MTSISVVAVLRQTALVLALVRSYSAEPLIHVRSSGRQEKWFDTIVVAKILSSATATAIVQDRRFGADLAPHVLIRSEIRDFARL